MPLPSNLHTSSSPEGETLALTGKQVDQLHQAICSAFPSSSSLEMMVRTKLEKNLSDIAGGTNLTEIVFNLIKWAEAQGKLQELVQKAYETIPDNPKLRRFSAQLSRLSTIPVPPVGNTVNASTVLIDLVLVKDLIEEQDLLKLLVQVVNSCPKGTHIRLIGIYPGSIRVRLEVLEDVAKHLLELVNSGQWSDFGVHEAEIVQSVDNSQHSPEAGQEVSINQNPRSANTMSRKTALTANNELLTRPLTASIQHFQPQRLGFFRRIDAFIQKIIQVFKRKDKRNEKFVARCNEIHILATGTTEQEALEKLAQEIREHIGSLPVRASQSIEQVSDATRILDDVHISPKVLDQFNRLKSIEAGTVPPGIQIEYKALRDEILKRIEMRQQLVLAILTLAGVFLSLGLTNSTPIVLIYPLLGFFIAKGWVHNDWRIRDIAGYIRKDIESWVPHMGWEYHLQGNRPETGLNSWSRHVVGAHGGTLLTTQITALVIGLSKLSFTQSCYVFTKSTLTACLTAWVGLFLLIVAIFSIISTIRIFQEATR